MPPIEVAQDEAPSFADLAGPAPDTTTAVAPPADDPVSTALAEVTTTNNTITQHLAAARELAERYRDVVWDVRTTKGMDEAKAARHALREQGRYPIQKLKATGSKLLGTMQRQFNARCEEVIGEIEGYEQPIDELITAEETRKENERREREEAEQRRRQGHLDALASITRHVTEAVGDDSDGIQERIDGLNAMVLDESWEEFQGQAAQARDEALRQLQGLLVAARAEEAELEETRQAQARLREQQEAMAARERQQAEERAKFEAERAAFEQEKAALERARQERAQSVQRRIEALTQYGAAYSHMAPSVNIESAIRTLHDTLIYPSEYDDRTAEAEAAKAGALEYLRGLYDVAVKREAQEAAAAQAARIEELIASIRSMGENAALAVTDGSAEIEGLRAGLAELRGLDLSELDGREAEAEQARVVAVSAIEGAIIFTQERDRLRAEEEERQRIEQQRRAHEDMRQQLMRDNAILLFPAAQELVDFIEAHVIPASDIAGDLDRLTDDVRNILRRVPKEQGHA